MENFVFLESTKKMPMMSLPVRSVVVCIGQNRILISPGSGLMPTQFESLGSVTDIVAPSLFHTGGIKMASKLYPEAKLWNSANLSPKSWPYQNELPVIHLKGMPKVNESVFVHKKSRSLIVADLCFNMIDAKGFGPWMILSLFGTYRKLGVSRFFLKFVEDRVEFENSLKLLFSHEFENIIVSHGENILGQASSKLKQALIERGFMSKS